MVDWKSLKNRIPIRVQLNKNTYYEIVYTDDFVDGRTIGEMRPAHKQIAIKLGQSPKMTVVTYLHEVLHAVSEEAEANLTENQILALEQVFYYILKSGNVFK